MNAGSCSSTNSSLNGSWWTKRDLRNVGERDLLLEIFSFSGDPGSEIWDGSAGPPPKTDKKKDYLIFEMDVITMVINF